MTRKLQRQDTRERLVELERARVAQARSAEEQRRRTWHELVMKLDVPADKARVIAENLFIAGADAEDFVRALRRVMDAQATD